jgi:hypothetical protein
MLTHDEALEALRELAAARPLLDHWTAATRATMILDRSSLRSLDVVNYLFHQEVEGIALARITPIFGTRLRLLYVQQYGVAPLHRLEAINGERRPVNAYLELDRPLFDRAWREISVEYDKLGARVSEIARTGETAISGMVSA